jgi:hypothetical protein
MDLDRWAKKTQYLTIDSDFVRGSNNAFSVYFGIESNVFLQEMRDVVGLKLVDFFASNINSSVVKYFDVISNDIPLAAQILDERNGQVFARIMNERDFATDVDKQGKIFSQKLNYFNPISIKQLAFKVNEGHVDGSYLPLNPGTQFHMVVEVTTLDYLNPPVDNNFKLINAIDNLVRKVDELIAKIPKPEELKKKDKISSWYILVIVGAIAGMWYWFTRPSSSGAAPVPTTRAFPTGSQL